MKRSTTYPELSGLGNLVWRDRVTGRPVHVGMSARKVSTFKIPLGALATEYGCTLDARPGRADLGDSAEVEVELYRDEDGEWHIEGLELLDEEWAPTSDAQARSAFIAAWVARGRPYPPPSRTPLGGVEG